MKKQIFILGLFFAGILVSHAQEECDTLKLKVIKSHYLQYTQRVGGDFKFVRELDGAVINIDTLPSFYLGASVVNVSNDTFSSANIFSFGVLCSTYADTGILVSTWGTIAYSFGRDFFPNDTINMPVDITIDLLNTINWIKENKDVDFEEINYRQMIIGIGYTDKDGVYSDSIFYASADTSIFYVVKTPVNIQETKKEASVISVFPNPARSQFTITNTENTEIQLYNMVGQEVLRTYSKEENTVVNVDFLPQGMYVLKVLKGGVFSTHKIVINNKQY
jgi:hypothetical protein